VAADEIKRVVDGVGAPINVLAMRRTPPVPVLAGLGVRRVSTGGGLARAAYGALVAAVHELQGAGTSTYLDAAIAGSDLDAALEH
jgi:2-methylisocitrate lyase-like PEP mutase family enzyme